MGDKFISRFMYMNLSIDPCEDFYEYSCGNWDSFHPIPKDSSENNVFSLLSTNIEATLKELLANLNADNSLEYETKKFYKSCSDTKKINERSSQPLLNFIDLLGGWPALDDNWSEKNFNLIDMLAKQLHYGHKSLFPIATEVDLANSKNYTIYLEGPSYGLSTREDYLNQENIIHFNAYKNLLITILNLLDVELEKCEEISTEIINFEIDLLNFTLTSMSDVELTDIYFETSLEELIKNYSTFDWSQYFNSIYGEKVNLDQKIVLFGIISLDEYIQFINKSDIKTITNYVVWQSVKELIQLLDERFTSALQVFEEAFTGQKEGEIRWKQCVKQTNNNLGWLAASMYIKATGLDENAKNDVIKLTEEILDEFLNNLNQLNWIDSKTKIEAELKVNNTILAVGYPDFVIDKEKLKIYYDGINLDTEKYFENYLILTKFEKSKEFKRLKSSVDENEWPIIPAIVNAFFEQTKNRIVMPSGILQPPIYHKSYPRALKYGAIGAFIGHELTHGFDDTGREFDFNGNMRMWWSNNSIEHFREKTKCFVEQYNNFTYYGKSLTGESSKGENIADNGGLRQAFSIYKKWLKNANFDELENEKLPNLDLTDEKLFFVGFAQSWCGNVRPEGILHRLGTDFHCPGKFRVIGTLQNFEEFSRVYNCPIDSPMNPLHKCRLW